MTRVTLTMLLPVCFASSALGCSGSQRSASEPPPRGALDPCAPGGRLRPPDPRVVASARTADRQIVEFIPLESQTPDGRIATPPTTPPESPSAAPALTRALPAGPPGTVPRLRSRFPQCQCFDGYLQQASGTCAPLAENCIQEGGLASSKSFTQCCPGLGAGESLALVDAACTRMSPDAHVCIRCGNGICGAGENQCNCPVDCSKPAP